MSAAYMQTSAAIPIRTPPDATPPPTPSASSVVPFTPTTRRPSRRYGSCTRRVFRWGTSRSSGATSK